MNHKRSKFGIRARLSSFRYAFRGLIVVCKNEPNFLIHIIAAVAVIVLGFVFQISRPEWIAIILCIGFVFFAEILNSSVENLTDMVSPHANKKAGTIKDIAASAVLIAAITAALTGSIIFFPYIFN